MATVPIVTDTSTASYVNTVVVPVMALLTLFPTKPIVPPAGTNVGGGPVVGQLFPVGNR